MPSTMEVRSFVSIRDQSCSNQRSTASNCRRFRLSSSGSGQNQRLERDVILLEVRQSARGVSLACMYCWIVVIAAPTGPRTRSSCCQIDVLLDQHEIAWRTVSCPLRSGRSSSSGIDGAFVNIEQRHVVVEHLVQQDDELDQVRVGLLPERFLALAEEVVQQTRDAVRQRICLQIVVQRVVPKVARRGSVPGNLAPRPQLFRMSRT